MFYWKAFEIYLPTPHDWGKFGVTVALRLQQLNTQNDGKLGGENAMGPLGAICSWHADTSNSQFFSHC